MITKKTSRLVLKWLFALSITNLANPAFALDPACDNLGGAVVLKDTLYGGLTGAIITGLVILASDGEAAGQNVAIGSAIGAGVGATYGIYETTRKDCKETVIFDKPTAKTAWNISPNFAGKTVGLKWQYDF